MSDPPGPALPEDPDLGELRGRLHAQWKAERRAEEREAIREHWLQRDLVQAAADAMHRGVQVALTLPGDRTLAGHLVATGHDYALLRAEQKPTRDVAVRLTDPDRRRAGDPYTGPHVLIQITEAADSTNPPDKPVEAPPTFQAVLHHYDFQQQTHPTREVELGTVFHPHGLICRFHAHAWDHLYVRDRNRHQIFLPAGAVTYITWSLPNDIR